MSLDSNPELFADVPDARRRIMRSIRNKETVPERLVRSLLHAEGYRFRKNLRGLPGRPDVAFTARKKVVFVHGCFWHAHADCKSATVPRTRKSYWASKLTRNAERDRENVAALELSGWATETVWECELRNPKAVLARPRKFVGSSKMPSNDRAQESDA